MNDTKVEWSYNCLTAGIHHGRPETLWNLPLLQATVMFSIDELKEMVIARIYNDALQYINHSHFVQKGTGAIVKLPQEWADQIKQIADELYLDVLKTKLMEISQYYASSFWHNDVEGVIERIKANNLSSNYYPLHSHDTINMLCRILGTSSSQKISTKQA